MKYLSIFESFPDKNVKFNEGVTSEGLKNIKDFCNECLVYLLDEGFVVFVTASNNYQVELRKDPYGSFRFETIKEDFLSFIEALHDKYEILRLDRNDKSNIKVNGLRSNGEYLMDDLIEENVSIDFPILSIIFNISAGKY